MFCNPPYGRAIADWVRKGYEESRKPGTTVVMLIPSRTDTAYFHDWIFGKASEVRFLRGRLKFTDEDGNGEDAAPFPSAVIVWRSPENTGREFATWHIQKYQSQRGHCFAGSDKEENMDGITKQTRRQSYDGIRTRSGERCKLILETLGNRSMTVEEITDELVAAGHLKYYDRNFVAPRLTELKGAGVLEVVGKKPSKRTGKNTAVWAAVRR